MTDKEYIKELFSDVDKLGYGAEIPPNMIYPLAFLSRSGFKTNFLNRIMSGDRLGRNELLNLFSNSELSLKERSDNENMNRIL